MLQWVRKAPRSACGAAAAWALWLLVGSCSCEQPPAARNAILITLDTTRADRLGCYGHGVDTSPNMDALAREGALFDFCISTSAVTPVSHASILTGLNPYSHGLRVLFAQSGYHLDPRVPTLATILKDRGWSTAAFLSAFPVSEIFGLDQGFDPFDNGLPGKASGVISRDEASGFDAWDTTENQRRSDATMDAALAWLAEAREPFFAWIHLWDPHDPLLVPPKETLRRFAPELEVITQADLRVYDAEIYWMDRQVGRLREALERSGQLDETVIAITADHGEGWGEHGWHAHRLLYQEQIHLPLVLRGPGIQPGSRVGELVRSIDLFPTVLELLGEKSPQPVEGESLLGLIRGDDEAPRLAYADQLNKWDTNAKMLAKRPGDDLLHVLMDRRWKLIYRPLRPDESELYDLREDPDEARNLYAADHPEAQRLSAELLPRNPFVLESLGQGDEASRAHKALQELGYIDETSEDTGPGGAESPRQPETLNQGRSDD